MIIRGDEPIFIHRRSVTGEDAYGQPTYSVETILIRDALFSYGGTSEPVMPDRDPIDARLTLFLPEGTDVHEGDRFEIRETMWEKDGDPESWPQLWAGFVPGVVLQIRRRRG